MYFADTLATSFELFGVLCVVCTIKYTALFPADRSRRNPLEFRWFRASLSLMKTLVGASLLLSTSLVAQSPPATHFVHGQWFDGTRFVSADFYAEDGLLTHTPRDPAHALTVDLHNGFVVPPYGDAHEHNFDGIGGTQAVVQRYLHDGIFYAQGVTDTTVGAQAVVAAHLVDTPTSPDVTYAHGGLTGITGHPKEVYDSIALGFSYPATPQQRAAVSASHARRGQAYWEIATAADLEEQWPKILAAKPDLIKVYLLHSESFRQATATDPQLGSGGIDPRLVPLITAKAHAAGLRVAAHVDTAADFHNAVAGGVDILAHMPGYGFTPDESAALYRIADADIALAANKHCVVIPTASLAVVDPSHATAEEIANEKRRKDVQHDNLTRLKAAGIPILIGSDHYGQDSVLEADYLNSLALWSNLELLRMWAVTTPQNIFPKRHLGELKPGYEASFLVLAADPLQNWPATHKIQDRWKQGTHITTTPPAEPSGK